MAQGGLDVQSLLIEEPYPPELRSSWQLRIEAGVQLVNGSKELNVELFQEWLGETNPGIKI